ncbi:E3 ubiquitin protein ligase RIN2-like [Pistacia vera]|uniref:E3 ubiquitin protein ligase RIN2-like n=1 Tax=Pistacia vera TaxID=55513 RepID=UPI001263AA13|nr:E3 ubiquitin protein ligase RIN2-like [Pistacia vera]
MGVSYLAISAVCTVLSFVGLQWWTEFSLHKLRTDGLIGENLVDLENANHALELFLGSYATVALLANFALNVFILLILCLKTIFFVELYPSETRKFVERLINYVIYKGTFLPLVVPPTVYQMGLWSIWLTVLCSLKPFEIIEKIGKVAYKLKLPTMSKIHPIFHVFVLKKKLGADHVVLDVLPEVNSIDQLIPSPKVVLDQQVRKGKTEILVHWKGLSPADSTWNVRDLIQERFLDFILEDEDAL